MERPCACWAWFCGMPRRFGSGPGASSNERGFYTTAAVALMSWALRQQHRRARRAAPFEVRVRAADIRERITLIDARLDLARHQHVEQFGGHRLVVAAFGYISEERRAREEQRTASGELRRIDRRQRPRRIAEAHEHTKRREAIERGRKRVFTD